MPPRKNKKIINNDGVKSSAAANKRTRLNDVKKEVVCADYRLSTPSPSQQQDAVDDELVSSLLPYQNQIIEYHMNHMVQSVEKFWRMNFGEEVKKMREVEAKLREKEVEVEELRKVFKEKDEKVERYRFMYNYYTEKAVHLEDKLEQQRIAAGEGCIVGTKEEDVQSCNVGSNTGQETDVPTTRPYIIHPLLL